MKHGIVCISFLLLLGCQRAEPPKEIVVQINDYQVTSQEFQQGFAQSPFAAREDKMKASQDYLDSLIDQKLILQDAQKKNLDKDKNFLKSIERFWEQSLLTVALRVKGEEISGSAAISDDQIHNIYDQMVKDGVTTKSYEEMSSQIKWMSQKQSEQQKLGGWIKDLRKGAVIQVNQGLLQAAK